MAKNNIKLLLESFKHYLSEEEERSIYNLALRVSPDGNWCGFVLYNPKKMREYIIENAADLKLGEFHGGRESMGVIGAISTMKNRGQCGDAYEIKGSGIYKQYKGQKLGRMLYGVVMSYIYPDLLMADRSSVSSDAGNLWQSFEENPKIEKWPPKEKPYKGEFDNIENTKTPPEDDDCSVYSKNRDYLNKAYRYNPSEVNKGLVKKLIANHEKLLDSIDSEPIRITVERDILEASYVFADIYFGGR